MICHGIRCLTSIGVVALCWADGPRSPKLRCRFRPNRDYACFTRSLCIHCEIDSLPLRLGCSFACCLVLVTKYSLHICIRGWSVSCSYGLENVVAPWTANQESLLVNHNMILLVITDKRFNLFCISLRSLPSNRTWLDFSWNLLRLLHRLLLLLLLWMSESSCKVLVTAYCSSGCCNKHAALMIKRWKRRRLWELSHCRQIPRHIGNPRRRLLENQRGDRNWTMIGLTFAECKVQWLHRLIVATRRHWMLDEGFNLDKIVD